MVIFEPCKNTHGAAFAFELARLYALMTDMEKIGRGVPPDRLARDAPILDYWVGVQRPTPCLSGLSTGHPILKGEARPVVTSDLWLLSTDRLWARTLSRWYRLGRSAESVRRSS